MRKLLFGSLIVCSTIIAAPAMADIGTPAFTITDDSDQFGGGNWNLGWSFTVDQPLNVTSLAYYDDRGDDLLQAHDVAIWRESDQTMLVSGTVSPGDLLEGLFRYTKVDGPTLVPGETYIVAGTSGADTESQNNAGTYAKGIHYVEARWRNDGALGYPDQTAARSSGYHGASFGVGPVPAPGAIALLGIAGLAARRRRRN